MKHTVPIQATFNLFKYLNITPSVNITDRMYKNKMWQHWDPATNTVVTDTTYGFYNILDFTSSVSLDTKIYGFFRPAQWAGGKKIAMIRHVMTPTISFSGAPDFSNPFWGAYGEYHQGVDANTVRKVRYNHFNGSIFGAPSQGKSGVISFNLANNVEMKLRSDNDSVPEKKISLIENLAIGTSYNLAADSCQWSDVTANLLLRLVKNFNLNLNTTWDPYFYKAGVRGSGSSATPYYYKSSQTRLGAGRGFLRLKSVGTSFSYTFTNDTFRRKNSSGKGSSNDSNRGTNSFDGSMQGSDDDPGTDDDSSEGGSGGGLRNRQHDDGMEFNPDGYMAWSCPWSLTLNYSFNLHEDAFNYQKLERDYAITQNLSVSGNIRPTANWNFSMSASYDFNTHRINYMNCSVTRDLHCFTMTASFVPLGPYKSYNFHIAVTSSLLADLKYDKRSSTSNGIRWY